jgi:hypothetical protein
MHRIDSPGNVGGLFDEGVPNVTEATELDADWFNAVQEELCKLVEDLPTVGAGTLVKGTYDQVYTQLLATFGRLGAANTWSAANTFSGGITQTSAITTSALAAGGLQKIGEYPIYNGDARRMRLYTTEVTHGHAQSFTLTWNASWSGSAWVADVNAVAHAITIAPDLVKFYEIAAATTSPGDANFGGVRAAFATYGVRRNHYISTAASPHNSVTQFLGQVAIKIGTSGTVVNNAAFTATSVPMVQLIAGAVRDTTLTEVWCTIATGTLTIYGNANATADVTVAWRVDVPVS